MGKLRRLWRWLGSEATFSFLGWMSPFQLPPSGWAALMSAVVFMWSVARDFEWPVIIVLVTAMFALVMVIANAAWSWRFKSQWTRRANSLCRKFGTEWDGHIKTRSDFWASIHSAYAQQGEKLSTFNDVEDLIRRAGFPAGVLYYTGEIRNFAELEREEGWDVDRKKLAAFCATFYARREKSSLTDKELNDFDAVRMQLSKFWDRWGREVYFYQTIKPLDLPELIAGQTAQMLLLVYLEIARAEWNRDEGPGKRWLFQLSKEFVTYDAYAKENKQIVI